MPISSACAVVRPRQRQSECGGCSARQATAVAHSADHGVRSESTPHRTGTAIVVWGAGDSTARTTWSSAQRQRLQHLHAPRELAASGGTLGIELLPGPR